jgi:hypothetical protein
LRYPLGATSRGQRGLANFGLQRTSTSLRSALAAEAVIRWADLMELLAAIALIAILFWYGKARAKGARRAQAISFTYDAPDGCSTWIGNFTTSRLHYRFLTPNPDPSDPDLNRDYELRRDTHGAWSIRLTNESWAKALQSARKDSKDSMPQSVRDAANAELLELGDEPSWHSPPLELLPLLESRYQVFAEEFGRNPP